MLPLLKFQPSYILPISRCDIKVCNASGQYTALYNSIILTSTTRGKSIFEYILYVSTGATTHCGFALCTLQPAIASSLTRFLDHTQRRATVGRTPLDEWSVRHRDLYLTTHNSHNRQTSMPPVGFEPTISVGERP